MKASEAIAILEGLDPNHDVTLTLSAWEPKKLPHIPKWNGAPMYPPVQPHWMTKEVTSPYTITCH